MDPQSAAHRPIRIATLRALFAIGPGAAEALPVLHRAAVDDDPVVRLWARRAIDSIAQGRADPDSR